MNKKLYDFCVTDKDRELLDAMSDGITPTMAAKRLGIDDGNARRRYRIIVERAAKAGYAPEASNMSMSAPSGFAVKRFSARFDKEGKPAGGWIISAPEQKASMEAFEQACADAANCLQGLAAPKPNPVDYEENFLGVIPMGDPHFGMLAWAEESGDNFDLKIAEQLTFDAVDRLCAMMPPCKEVLLLNLGDYFHADNATNRTPMSGNQLDVDGRFQKIASVGFRAMIRCIDRLLESHDTVTVRNNRGNHDPHQAVMLTISLSAYYHNEPRVTVADSPSGFYYQRFGVNLIGSTHGDGAKAKDLPMIMANDAAHYWSKTKHRVWHCGHVHHDTVKDEIGCRIETHRTLAGTDAWHAYQGYRSMRDMKAIIYHKQFGEVMRLRCGVELADCEDD